MADASHSTQDTPSGSSASADWQWQPGAELIPSLVLTVGMAVVELGIIAWFAFLFLDRINWPDAVDGRMKYAFGGGLLIFAFVMLVVACRAGWTLAYEVARPRRQSVFIGLALSWWVLCFPLLFLAQAAWLPWLTERVNICAYNAPPGFSRLAWFLPARAMQVLPEYFAWVTMMSIHTFLMYGDDKYAAISNEFGARMRRTSEAALHSLEKCGGWPGALAAQVTFAHKTSREKAAFRRRTYAAIGVHIFVAMFWLMLVWPYFLGGPPFLHGPQVDPPNPNTRQALQKRLENDPDRQRLHESQHYIPEKPPY